MSTSKELEACLVAAQALLERAKVLSERSSISGEVYSQVLSARRYVSTALETLADEQQSAFPDLPGEPETETGDDSLSA